MKILSNIIEDILIIAGAGCIIFATFMLSTVAGIYCFGGMLLALGLRLAVKPRRKE